MQILILSIITALFSLKSYANYLHFIGDVNFPTAISFQGTPIGGLSGISYNEKNKTLYAISDDQSKIAPARIYEFNIDLRQQHFSVTPINITPLKNDQGETYKQGTIDFEDIALIQNNNIIIVSEKDPYSKIEKPGLYEYTADGTLVKKIEIPDFFESAENQGIRSNLSSESVAQLPDGNKFFVGIEGALKQDGDIISFAVGNDVRILEFTSTGDNYKQTGSYIYPLSQIPNPDKIKESNKATNGLVALLSIDLNHFLALERSFIPETKRNIIRLFLATKSEKTTDVMNMRTIKNKNIKTMQKKLIFDFDQALPLMNPNYQYLDNIEGMSWGPKLKNGDRTLIFVSDNNFSPSQRTVFLAFSFKMHHRKK